MKILFLLLALFGTTAIFGQNQNLESTWKIDSLMPNSDTLDDMDLLAVMVMTMLEEDDKPTFLKFESNKISMQNAKQEVLETSNYYRIENEGNPNETTIIIEEKPFLFVKKDDSHAELSGANVIYYLSK